MKSISMWKMQIPVLKFQKQIFSEVGRETTHNFTSYTWQIRNQLEKLRGCIKNNHFTIYLEKNCNVLIYMFSKAQFEKSL